VTDEGLAWTPQAKHIMFHVNPGGWSLESWDFGATKPTVSH